MITIQVNPSDGLPIYRQIMRQISAAIAGGGLRPGDKLASHRDLATQVVVAPLTVKKAYDELEQQGLIETRRGRGTFVVARPNVDVEKQRARLAEMAKGLLDQAHLAGFDVAYVVRLLEDLARQHPREGNSRDVMNHGTKISSRRGRNK